MALHLPKKAIPLRALRISLDDVVKIFERLSRLVAEQADLEIGQLGRPEGKSDEEFQKEKQTIREKAFRITVTITGPGGESVFGDDVGIFQSSILPVRISAIFMTNITAYQGFTGNKPLTAFELHIDCSKPPLMDGEALVSSPTINVSNLTAQGDRDAWVAAISDAVLGVTQHRRTKRAWIHVAFAYDIGLMIFGFPLGLYVCWKLSDFVENIFGEIDPVLSAAAYIYIVLVVVWAYRAMFGYTKWAFPIVELINNQDAAGRHRVVWSAIVLGLVIQVIWEILRAV